VARQEAILIDSQGRQNAERVPGGLGAFLADTGVLYARWLVKLTRRPVALYFSLVQPVIWLFLFGQMFSRMTQFPRGPPSAPSYLQFFIPTVILQTCCLAPCSPGSACSTT
jgi:ABC-2 type transport system permease protein